MNRIIPLEIREYKLNIHNLNRVYQFFLQHTSPKRLRCIKKDESGLCPCYCILEIYFSFVKYRVYNFNNLNCSLSKTLLFFMYGSRREAISISFYGMKQKRECIEQDTASFISHNEVYEDVMKMLVRLQQSIFVVQKKLHFEGCCSFPIL